MFGKAVDYIKHHPALGCGLKKVKKLPYHLDDKRSTAGAILLYYSNLNTDFEL